MTNVRDQSDEIKLLQFKKFYPDVFNEIRQNLQQLNIGKKVDRRPPKEN